MTMVINKALAICCTFSFILLVRVHAQGQTALPSTEGFISLDCGILDNQNYTDSTTQLPYTSDSGYIDAGKIKNIDANYINSSSPRYHQTVRFFPDGKRNCYMFNINNISSSWYYLVRATFFYGYYDGLHSVQTGNPISFDLYLGANLWTTVNIFEATKEYMFEAASYSYSELLFICLVNKNSGVPFISALEIRPADKNYPYYYPTSYTRSFIHRFNYGEANQSQTFRYPDDKYDRIWKPYPNNPSEWKKISTIFSIDPPNPDYAVVPLPVLQTAVTPTSSSDLIALQWKSETSSSEYCMSAHFAELESVKSIREFILQINGIQWPDTSVSVRLTVQMSQILYCSKSLAKADEYILNLSTTINSTLPPFINAIELYSIVPQENKEINNVDVKAIMTVKETYNITKNWLIGDPCFPNKYRWDGLSCSYDHEYYSYITSINLASFGLNGPISDSFKSFYYLDNLDLSCNNLTGSVPDFLGNMNITHLNLAGNPLLGPIPNNLLNRSSSGLLTLLHGSGQCGEKTGNSNMKIIIGVTVASTVLLAILILVVWKFRGHLSSGTSKRGGGASLHVEFQQFTGDELKLITNNFSDIIGKGGFGTVYRGLTENKNEVAVKMPTNVTEDVIKQFLSEAKSLMQVRHRNLVTLVGYCIEENMHALVCEYMTNGSLYDHLTSENNNGRVLSWGERLRIALESAQGLDYLHTGCMIAHRDVKSNNILLGPNFEAKFADFGLAKMLNECTGMGTVSLCGTPGYIDPEFQQNPLGEKSDVYSFGIVLLEIVTGEAPIVLGRQNVHLVAHVKNTLANGNISDVVDSRLESDYSEETVLKVIDMAMRCAKDSSQRPVMAEVVTILRDCLSEENLRSKNMKREGGAESEAYSASSSLLGMGPSAR